MKKIGKYRVIEELGKGGMGVVYKAHDPDIDREVAIKLILEKVLESKEVRARFIREAKTAARFYHENITIVHESSQVDNMIYIVMEYLEGRNLRSIIDTKELIPLEQKLDYSKQICRGLQFAHSNKIIHRDIKPENIKILDNDRVKIIDFGIAKPDTAETDAGTVLTKVGMRIGTPWYMSPEQVKGIKVDRRSDIFSFGVLLYEFLTYQMPFEGDDTTVMYKIQHEQPEKFNIEESGLIDELQIILLKCLEKERDARYNDCGELLRDLERVSDKARQEQRIQKLLNDGGSLAEEEKFGEAIQKLKQILQIAPDHQEANKLLKKLIEQEREIKNLKVLTGRISGETISHYKILERLGQGGMGVVYKAEDIKLRREVALKFLSPELIRDAEAKKRFLKEAQAASALDHPNICTIYEINETEDGLMFICMAYYEGENLREKISQGDLDEVATLNTVIEVARGLARAHENGIVHRDIKPANIILTREGKVKIVDFGLAKAGGESMLQLSIPTADKRAVMETPMEYLKQIPTGQLTMLRMVDAVINVASIEDPDLFADVPEERLAATRQAAARLGAAFRNASTRNVTLGQTGGIPTEAYAKSIGAKPKEITEMFWKAVSVEPDELAMSARKYAS
ncbi:protein kinase, partial [candidate division KSB1 bacterium]|nr:protein kinase [candidate division KSB1 bacterium]